MTRDSQVEMNVPRRASFSSADGGGDRCEGWIVGLSIHSAQITTIYPPPPTGADVVVESELLEGEGVVTLRGRVDQSGSEGFDVRFGPLGEEDTKAIVRASQRPPPP